MKKGESPRIDILKSLLSGCRLWIWVLICQLPHFFHPSLHPFPSFPDVITLHHTVISLILPTLPSSLISPPRHSFAAIFTCQNDHLSRVCVCVLVHLCKESCLSGQWSEEKTVCILNYSSETGKRQRVKVSECVYLHAISCLCTGIPAFLSQAMCLFKYLFPSLRLSLRPICRLRANAVVKSSRQTS